MDTYNLAQCEYAEGHGGFHQFKFTDKDNRYVILMWSNPTKPVEPEYEGTEVMPRAGNVR